MHPRMIEQLASHRSADLRRSASMSPARPSPRYRIRSRVGWALVGIGLRMADSADS